MISKAQIVAQLTAAGVDPAFHDVVAQRAFYGDKTGEDAEDFIQEAILAHLSGGDISKSLTKLSKQQRQQQSLDEMLEGDSGDGEYAIDLPEKVTTDNDRPDWIPNGQLERMALITEIWKHLAKNRKASNDSKSGGWRAHVMIWGHAMQFTGHKTPEAAVKALRGALKRILGWCLPLDDRYFTKVCVQCGGPKSIYGVRFCSPCYRGGASKGKPA